MAVDREIRGEDACCRDTEEIGRPDGGKVAEEDADK
jgi:hypothetical protein